MSSLRVTLMLFAKAPVPGTVKTRLTPALSPQDASTLHSRLVSHTAAALAGARDALPESSGELWCAPDCSDPTLALIAIEHRLALRAQQGDNLGARMRHALSRAMPGIAILVGSDCPLLDSPLLLSAVEALAVCDAVFVPTEDGGYALIGCRERVPDCFDGIAWSTDDVMRATWARLKARGMRWRELPRVWDVDTPQDLGRLRADVRFAQLTSGLTVHPTAAREHRIEQPL
jgi:rSAM/selenodomain-associated transferase 1